MSICCPYGQQMALYAVSPGAAGQKCVTAHFGLSIKEYITLVVSTMCICPLGISAHLCMQAGLEGGCALGVVAFAGFVDLLST
jgi:hypothetical protein